MKKNLFTKFLALFLTGTMLVGVGCKDYDDDIKDINNRLDELVTGKIATLEQQVTSMQSTVSALQSADKALGERIDALKADGDKNKAEIDKLTAAQATLRSDIDKIEGDYVSSSLLGSTLSAYTATADLGQICIALEKLGDLGDNKTIAAAIEAAKQSAITIAGEALEEAFKTKLDAYYTNTQVDGKIEGEIEDYDEKIKGFIEDAVLEKNGYINKEIARQVKNAVDGLKERLDKVEKDVAALAGQIQSLVYVPAYDDGTSDFNVYTLGTQKADNSLTMKFRVSPASMAAKMEALKSSLELVLEEVKTRAAAPKATITDIAVVDASAGTFTVSANVENAPAGNFALALAVNTPVMDGSTVANDVVSNFGVLKAQNKAISVKIYNAEDKEVTATEALKMSWDSKVASSKLNLLDGCVVKVSLDGKNYISLEQAAAITGADIKIGKYTAAAKYYNADNSEVTTETDIKKFALVAATKDLVWPSKAATVAFRELCKSTDVGKYVSVDHTIAVNVGETMAVELTPASKYEITNTIGGSMSFAEQLLPWSYKFVEAGLATNNATPEVTGEVFDEIAVVNVPEGVKLETILGGAEQIEVTPAGPTVTFTHVASTVGKGIKIGLKDYEWGKTYAVKATYTVDNTDYQIAGTIKTGAAPKDIEVKYTKMDMKYDATMKLEGNWADVFAKAEPKYFADQAELLKALFATGSATAITNKRYEKATATTATDVTNSSMTIAGDTKPAAVIAKDDVLKAGNKFVQTATITTWYGQKVTIEMTSVVVAETVTILPHTEYVTNNVVELMGKLNASNVWAWEEATLSAYYYASPTTTTAKIKFSSISEDKDTKVFAKIAGDKLDWTAANQGAVELKAYAQIDDKLTVAEQAFTVKVKEPIATLAQTKSIEKKYTAGTPTEADLLSNLSLIDANAKAWIDAGVPVKAGNNTAKTVFAATTGTDDTAGIKFEVVSAKNADGSDSNPKVLDITDNKLTFEANSATLQQDITITVKATFTYQFGSKVNNNIKVVIKK